MGNKYIIKPGDSYWGVRNYMVQVLYILRF